jgi:hypothetical protein
MARQKQNRLTHSEQTATWWHLRPGGAMPLPAETAARWVLFEIPWARGRVFLGTYGEAALLAGVLEGLEQAKSFQFALDPRYDDQLPMFDDIPENGENACPLEPL